MGHASIKVFDDDNVYDEHEVKSFRESNIITSTKWKNKIIDT